MTIASQIETYLKQHGSSSNKLIARKIARPLTSVKNALYELRKNGIVVATGPRSATLYTIKGALKTNGNPPHLKLKIELPKFEFSVAYDDVRAALRTRLVELHEETERVVAALEALKQ